MAGAQISRILHLGFACDFFLSSLTRKFQISPSFACVAISVRGQGSSALDAVTVGRHRRPDVMGAGVSDLMFCVCVSLVANLLNGTMVQVRCYRPLCRAANPAGQLVSFRERSLLLSCFWFGVNSGILCLSIMVNMLYFDDNYRMFDRICYQNPWMRTLAPPPSLPPRQRPPPSIDRHRSRPPPTLAMVNIT